jgi:sodium transport system permease protein
MRGAWVVFDKEVRDTVRDRRALTSGLVGALIGPLIILLLVIILGRTFFQDAAEAPLELPVEGADHAPHLIEFLQQNNVIIQPAPADPRAAVRNGEVDMVLVISPDYGEAFVAGRPATVNLVNDSTRSSAGVHVERARRLLNAYSRQVGALRLAARGVSPLTVQALAVLDVDVSTPQTRTLIFLNMLPYFLIFAIFSGGAGAVIDMTAGERERGSLEPLLINPVGRSHIVLGKLLAALPFSLLPLCVTLAAFAIIFNLVPLESFIGFRLAIDPAALAGILLICLPLLLLATALQMVIATFARTFREAQTYLGFLPLLPALPGLALAFLPVRPDLWTMLIPTFGQQILVNQFMRGEPVSPLNVLISTAVTLALGVAVAYIAARLYEREQVLFGSR